MNKVAILLFLSFLSCSISFSQSRPSPYQWKWKRDGIWTGTALVGGIAGYALIINKDDISKTKLHHLDEKDVNFADRWLAGTYNEKAIGQSYIPFGLSFVTPVLLLFNDKINEHTTQILGLYLESLATTAAMYTITAGLVDRSRPYVYATNVSEKKRLRNNGQRSFYSGHVAATATASFYAAKVFSDFNPDSSAKPYVWAGAATLPALVGYFRLKAGQHFLTDVLLGYALGGAAGYFIPELHHVNNNHINVYPTAGRTFLGDDYRGITFQYSF